MRTISDNKLKKILDKHFEWLTSGRSKGERADLRDAYLKEADLRYAELTSANLKGADLSYADLKGADLTYADLKDVDLERADLRGASLSYADLRGADLSHADLRDAKLRYAELRDTKIFIPMACPEEGSFIGYKKARDNYIVKLEILSDAKRCSGTGRKCRCSKARVLSITNIDGTANYITSVPSKFDSDFVYKIGEIVSVPDFDEDRWNECSKGIHFFITREAAVNY